jgi:hypothetical protein
MQYQHVACCWVTACDCWPLRVSSHVSVCCTSTGCTALAHRAQCSAEAVKATTGHNVNRYHERLYTLYTLQKIKGELSYSQTRLWPDP